VVVGTTTENDVRVLVRGRAERVVPGCREVEVKLVKEEAKVKGANVLVSTETDELDSAEVDAEVTKLNEALEVELAEELLPDEEESVAVELEPEEEEDPEEESELLVEVDSPDEVSSPDDEEDPEAEELEDPDALALLVGAEVELVVGLGLETGVLDPPSAKPMTP